MHNHRYCKRISCVLQTCSRRISSGITDFPRDFRRKTLLMSAILALGFSATVRAETFVDANGLGNHTPAPQDIQKIDDELSVRARIVHDKSGKLADNAVGEEMLRLELTFTTVDGAADRPIRFRCRVTFLHANGESPDIEKAGICYKGHLADGIGGYHRFAVNLRFQMKNTDPQGTSGVQIELKEEHSGLTKVLVPTYGWVRQ